MEVHIGGIHCVSMRAAKPSERPRSSTAVGTCSVQVRAVPVGGGHGTGTLLIMSGKKSSGSTSAARGHFFAPFLRHAALMHREQVRVGQYLCQAPCAAQYVRGCATASLRVAYVPGSERSTMGDLMGELMGAWAWRS